MDIKVNMNLPMKKFKEIEAGGVFVYNYEYYMKIKYTVWDGNERMYNAIQLKSGMLYAFHSESEYGCVEKCALHIG